jgi:hypothetical protein
MTRLEVVCETCGSRIADPPTVPNDRPARLLQSELGESEGGAVPGLRLRVTLAC